MPFDAPDGERYHHPKALHFSLGRFGPLDPLDVVIHGRQPPSISSGATMNSGITQEGGLRRAKMTAPKASRPARCSSIDPPEVSTSSTIRSPDWAGRA